jgi:hypothetical protein
MRGFNKWMNFILAALFTVLVACGQPVQDLEIVEPSKDEMFLDIVRDEYPDLLTVDKDALTDYAASVCALLEVGGTTDDLFDSAYNAGMDIEMAGFITGTAIGIYCPEHTP